MIDGLVHWWDSFELWLAQQWFPLQFVLVMAVLLPLCAVLAGLVDRAVAFVIARAARLRRVRRPDRAS